MAILLRGKTKCSLCELVIEEGQAVAAFPQFVANELDHLWMFSDGAFHAECFYRHPLADKAQARYKETKERIGPGKRFCIVCKKEVTEPDDYFTLGHLTEEQAGPLYRYNYLQAHESCLPEWPETLYVVQEIEKLLHSGRWRGNALARILADLRRAAVTKQ